jgi:LCP family protein required for cell wall assembly
MSVFEDNKNYGQKSNKIRKKASWPVKVSRFFAIFFMIVSLTLFSAISVVGFQITDKDSAGIGLFNFFELVPAVTNNILGNKKPIKGEAEGRTNFLLIGEDPEIGLTDTLMIASLYHKDKKISTVNIPRDFFIYAPEIGSGKVNSLYPAIKKANNDSREAASQYMASFMEKEFGVPIHYWATINVDGLRQAIDVVGGIDVKIETTFTDPTFPTDGYTGYMNPPPSFRAGTEKMDGKRASIYARSRYSTNPAEGSDFARSRRQSIVIQALLNKIKSTSLWDNVGKLNDYLRVIGKNVATNMTTEEMLSAGTVLKDMDLDNGFFRSTWATDNGFLCAPQGGSVGYIIGYGDADNCGNYFGGTSGVRSNPYKEAARKYVADLLISSQKDEVKKMNHRLFANKASNYMTIFTAIENFGAQIQGNNNLTTLPVSSKNTVKVYIQNPKIKTAFEAIKPTYTFDSTLIQELPQQVRTSLGNADLNKEIIFIIE